MTYYCGIDLGNKSTTICVIDKRRVVIKEIEITTDADSICREIKGYRKLECLVEAAPLAEWLSKIVEQLGHKITVVCARRVKIALESGGKKRKTDRRDARALAELCRSGWYEAVHRKSDESRSVRSYMKARKQLVECSAALASSMRGILRAHGIRLVDATDDKTFTAKVRRASLMLPELVRGAVGEMVMAFEQMHSQQRQMYRQLETKLKVDSVAQRLMTIPGVGPATAATFVATIDDPNRFSDGSKVASYLGLTPSIYQSGETEYRGRITKTGDKLLRWLLVEAANVLLSRSAMPCELKEWGLRLKEAKGIGKARVAVARRLCGIMLRLWKNNEVFYPESLGLAA